MNLLKQKTEIPIWNFNALKNINKPSKVPNLVLVTGK